MTGVVKFFNDEKGFGFITQDNGGPDLFVHRNEVNGGALVDGDAVTFTEAYDDRSGKQKAMNVSGGSGGEGGYGGGGGFGGGGGKGGGYDKGGKGDFGKGGKDFGKDNKRPLGGGCGKGSKGPDEAEVLGQFHGTIKSFNQANGYGFIDCPEIKMQYGKDIFLHHAQLGGFDVGEQVMFTAYLNSKGQPQGKNLVGVDGGPAKKMRHG
mmetsp:Transcript_53045/g.156244  ORF Transcript_53045/g.156244 Transcript_53045/m.156244 type:complete len:208 (-) Transcript_53045:31-654(-)